MAAGRRADPIAKFRFGVEIKGIVQGWFTECSGLTVQREVVEHKEGGLNDYVHKLPGRASYSNVTLKRGIAGGALWRWFCKGLYDGRVQRRNVSIILYSGDRKKAKRWNLTGAYPVKWTGPDFKTEGAEAAVETLELVHHGMEITGWTGV
jgi:phage tail-like protein